MMARLDRNRRRGLLGAALGVMALTVLLAAAPSDSPVADAAMRGDLGAVRALVERGADVNVAQGDGMTALHWAAERGDAEMTRFLLDRGAETGAITRIGDRTPLHLAARAGKPATVNLLLEAGADPMTTTESGGSTALHFAAAAGNTAIVRALLEHGAEIDAPEATWAQTPLMWAASAGRLAAVKTLIDAGADLEATSRVEDIPAASAASRAGEDRREEVLAEFREEAGNPVGWKPTPEQVQAAVKAAREATPERAEVLEDKPLDFEEATIGALSFADLVGRRGGLTPLLHAAREGHADVVLALLDAGSDLDHVSRGDHTSPLLMTVINGHFDLAMDLVERGADVTLASDAGTTPLYAAINTHWAPKARYPQQQAYTQQETTYLELMRVLLDRGADPNVRLTKHLWYMSYTFDLLGVDTKGATPFWRAAYATDVEAMKMLVAAGADPNIPTRKVPERRFRRSSGEEVDHSGLPPVEVGGPAVYPIHAASGVGYGEGFAGNSHRHVPDGWLPAVKYLVEELGADVNARDLNGYSPVHHAAARGDNEMILYLVERGADVTLVARSGQTTVDMANGPVQRIQPFPETIELLESLGAKNNHNCVSC
jgi:ankyrin repeat protein